MKDKKNKKIFTTFKKSVYKQKRIVYNKDS